MVLGVESLRKVAYYLPASSRLTNVWSMRGPFPAPCPGQWRPWRPEPALHWPAGISAPRKNKVHACPQTCKNGYARCCIQPHVVDLGVKASRIPKSERWYAAHQKPPAAATWHPRTGCRRFSPLAGMGQAASGPKTLLISCMSGT